MTGAVDNLDFIKQIIDEFAIQNYYIHADAALSGMILPFVNQPQAFGFDDGIDSIAISGHKMIDSPIPSGIALAKKTHVSRIARAVEYVSTFDTTVTGSRNAITPLFLWYALHTKGQAGFRQIIKHCLDTADYAIKSFKQVGITAWRNPNSITVVFPRCAEEVLKKWQIALQHDIAHLITMPHVQTWQIDAFIADIVAAQRQPTQVVCG